jgi:hypothetical protein
LALTHTLQERTDIRNILGGALQLLSEADFLWDMGCFFADSSSVSGADKSSELSFLGIPNLSFFLSPIPRLRRPHPFYVMKRAAKLKLKIEHNRIVIKD